MVTITSESDCGKKGGALACLGSEVEATIVASTFLPKMMQNAHLHLDGAIVTTTPLPPIPFTSFQTEMGKGVAMDNPLPKATLLYFRRSTSCLLQEGSGLTIAYKPPHLTSFPP